MLLETFSLAAGSRLSGHHHPRLHLCILRGGAFVERLPAGWRECGPGTVRISPPHAGHELQVDGQGARGEIVELPAAVGGGLSPVLGDSVYLGPSTSAGLVSRLLEARKAENRFGAEAAALELAARALVADPASRPPRWLRELREELDDPSVGPRSLDARARRHDRHRSHVARSFREWFGRSIGAHDRARRLAVGLDRLRTTEQSVADLAHELGFTDQAHFTRLFRARYGVPPGRFRQAARR